MTPLFKGRTHRGRLILENRGEFDNYIASLGHCDDIEVIVRKKDKERTLNQQGYYRYCVRLWANEIGYEFEELHRELRFIFLSVEGSLEPRSTTSLTTAEMSDYIDSVRRLAAEQGIILPDPEKVEI